MGRLLDEDSDLGRCK